MFYRSRRRRQKYSIGECAKSLWQRTRRLRRFRVVLDVQSCLLQIRQKCFSILPCMENTVINIKFLPKIKKFWSKSPLRTWSNGQKKPYNATVPLKTSIHLESCAPGRAARSHFCWDGQIVGRGKELAGPVEQHTEGIPARGWANHHLWEVMNKKFLKCRRHNANNHLWGIKIEQTNAMSSSYPS